MDYNPPRLPCLWNSPGKNTGVGCQFFLQGFIPTQGSNTGLLICRQILYHLSHHRNLPPKGMLMINFNFIKRQVKNKHNKLPTLCKIRYIQSNKWIQICLLKSHQWFLVRCGNRLGFMCILLSNPGSAHHIPGGCSNYWTWPWAFLFLQGPECSLTFLPALVELWKKNQAISSDTPLQYSCLENPMDGGAWEAAVHGVAKSRTRLRDFDFTFTFHFHALEKEMATHASVLAWRIPGMGEPSGLPSMGSHRAGHDWSDLAVAAAYPNITGLHKELH